MTLLYVVKLFSGLLHYCRPNLIHLRYLCLTLVKPDNDTACLSISQ
jgi:hypothetical protein